MTKPALFAKGSPFERLPPAGGRCRRRRQKGERAVERSETERVCSGRQPSPSRLRRATSPERERLWQRRKVCSLTAGFFLPLTNGGRNSPVLPRARPSGELSSAARLRGFVPEATLSVTASPCHLSRKGEALAKAESLCFTGQLVLSLTNKDETYPLCQGLHLRGRWHFAKRNDGRGSSTLFAKGVP